MEQPRKLNWSKIIIYIASTVVVLTLLDKMFVHSSNRSPQEIREQAARDSINDIRMLPLEVKANSKMLDSLLLTNNEFDDATKRLNLLKSVSAIYFKSQNQSREPTIRKKGKDLGQKITRFQIKQFPQLRKMFVTSKKDILWEEDIEIQAQGRKSDILVLTGGSFAPNKRKKQFMEAINETVHKLRFKKVIFKWYEYDVKNTIYQIDSPTDSEII
ncbi:hypothetical protein [Dyadobacter alkalitolerans]|uniref:hypothetical protein n=1 Tax=Dyadobacter alkalitolerans TaxID=492736 RepID=UPI00047C1962|nr:hypothetical protein [Dyadobacter alkalitolerans]